MSKSQPKAAYPSDQRNLSVSLWACRTGGTSYLVTWRHCQAGEDALREVVLLKGHWPNTLNRPWQGIRALVSVAKALSTHSAAKPD